MFFRVFYSTAFLLCECRSPTDLSLCLFTLPLARLVTVDGHLETDDNLRDVLLRNNYRNNNIFLLLTLSAFDCRHTFN